MTEDTLNERDFELINIIGAELASNQRELSRHLDLSLGSTNVLLKRMIAKGYIRIAQLNKKKVKYILTPKGFTEKTRKSIKYMRKTLSSIGLIKDRLRMVVEDFYAKGHRRFYILGGSDFAILVEMVIKEAELEDTEIRFIDKAPENKIDGLLLICKEDVEEDPFNRDNRVDLVKELAKADHFSF